MSANVKVLPTKAYASPANGKAYPYPHSSVSYQAIGILEWIGTLAMTAEHGEYVSGTRYPAPVGGAQLPLGAKVPAPVHQKKEKVPSIEAPAKSSCPKQWSLKSIVLSRDPKNWKVYGSRLDKLCAQLEKHHENNPSILPRFLTCRKRLELSLDRLLRSLPPSSTSASGTGRWQHHYTGGAQLPALLKALYEGIICCLEQLLPCRLPNDAQKAEKTPALENGSKKAIDKEDASTVLINWLRNNWINPYPDDHGLEELAARCGKDKDKVATWVGNARARKWRPALNQAIALQRPAGKLLEDSLAIFEGRPIAGVAYKRLR